MPSFKGSFPVLTKTESERFSLALESLTRVERWSLVDHFVGLNGQNPILLGSEIVQTPGKVSSEAWRYLNASLANVYIDESGRKRESGASQVETVRAFIKRIGQAFKLAFDQDFSPEKLVKLTDGEAKDTVDLWRVA